MRRRFQIVISNRQVSGAVAAPETTGFWKRFKLLFAGLTLTVVVVTILIVALLLGSILAAVIWIVLVIALAAVVVKATLNRATR